MAGNIKGITVEIGGNTTKLDASLAKSKQTAKGLGTELRVVNSALKFDPKNTTMLAQKQSLLKKSIASTEEKQKALNQAMEQIKSGKVKVTEEEMRYLERQIALTDNELKSLKKQMFDFGSVAAQRVRLAGESLKKLGGNIQDVGKSLAPVSAAAGAALGFSIKQASSFEKGMAKVNTIANLNERDLTKLSKGLLKVSTDTGKSANEIAEASYQALSASVPTKELTKFTNTAVRLAKTGFTSTSSAVDVLTTSINAYGLKTSEASKISDMLIQTQNRGKTTVAELASQMGNVIPTAAALNVNLANLATGYVQLTKQGINTAAATTELRSMLNELSKSGTAVDLTLKKKTGKSFAQLSADGKSLGDVLQILNDAVGGNSTKFKNLWGNVRAGAGALAIVNAGSKEFNKQLADMNNSSGNVDRASKTMVTNGAQAEKAINALKNASIALGRDALDALAPLIQKIAEGTVAMSNGFQALPSPVRTTIASTLALVAALSPALIVGGKLIVLTGQVMTYAPQMVSALALVKGGVTSLFGVISAHPIAALITASSALIITLMKLEKAHNDSVTSGNRLTASQKKQIEEINELKKSYDQINEARLRAQSEVNSEYNHIEALKKEYNSLIDSNGKVKKGYQERASFIVSTLASSLGMEKSQILQLVGANGKLGESIDKVIVKKKAEAMLQANQQAYTDAIKKQSTAYEKYATQVEEAYKSEKKLKKLKSERDQLESKTINTSSGYVDESQMKKLNDINKKIEAQQESFKKQKEAANTARESLANYTTTIVNYERLSTAAMSGSSSKISSALSQMNTGFKNASNATSAELKKQADMYARMYDSLKKTIGSKSDSVSKQQLAMAKSLKDNAAKEFKAASKKAGDSYAKGFDSTKGKVKSSAESLKNTAKNGSKVNLSQNGKAGVSTYASSISSGKGVVRQAASSVKNAAKTALKSNNSQQGKNVSRTYTSGISSGTGAAMSAAKAVSNGALRALKSQNATSAGSFLSSGFARGISSGVGGVMAAAKSLASKALQKMKETLKINSPSKITTEYGVFTAQGMPTGMEKEKPNVLKKMRQFGTDSVNAISLGINDTSSGLATGILGNLATSRMSLDSMMYPSMPSFMTPGKLEVKMDGEEGLTRAAERIEKSLRNVSAGSTYNINGLNVEGTKEVERAFETIMQFMIMRGRT